MSIDDFSLSDLFRVEAQSQVAKLSDGLISLDERVTAEQLEELMRAAHSLKGAARIVGHDRVVRLAHELEECFVAAQEGGVALTGDRVDVLLRGVDILAKVASQDPDDIETPQSKAALDAAVAELRAICTRDVQAAVRLPVLAVPQENKSVAASDAAGLTLAAPDHSERLLSLAGEALVASRVLLEHTRVETLARRGAVGLERALEELRTTIATIANRPDADRAVATLRTALAAATAQQRERALALDTIGQRVSDVVETLYQGVLDARMRPFADGAAGMPRMVRDISRELGRNVRLVITGESTPVDREVLRRLEAPLGHLLRNAVDHGIEPSKERLANGKAARGTIQVEARHTGGRLLVSVDDDGRGIDLQRVRARVVQRGLADSAAASEMSDVELSHFLFLPGFTLRDEVTSISGRGVGLDAVHAAVREIGGDVRVVRSAAGGTRFEMHLPLTLSVVRALVVEIGRESYAIPLARVHRILRVPRDEMASVEGRQQFTLDDRQVGLIGAHQLLGTMSPDAGETTAVVVIGDHESALGIVVDAFVGEHELVLRGLDARLGKVQDVGGAALLPDGAPTLVLDVDDLMRTAAHLIASGRPHSLRQESAAGVHARKRVLVVDDSLTVRELERKMIEGQGYAVDVAVDGMDAWNAIRKGHYDLVVTDVDMPRMDGIELVTRIKGDPLLTRIPVMIVSYKDRDEDRRRGLDAGADYYLTKGSFYDETMLRAIEDFIGGAA